MRPLDGYPQPFGYSKGSVFPHAGPASYVRIQPGSPTAVPPDGGDPVSAVEAGLKAIDFMVGGLTDDGLYEVVAAPQSSSETPNGASTTTYILVWYLVNTRTQVTSDTDLSGSVVRLFALGPK